MDFDTKIADGFRNKKGIFDPKNVKERAKICRRWLREQKESVIVGTYLASDTYRLSASIS